MFDNNPYFLQSEIDYRAEKVKRGITVRRPRNRKAQVRRQAHQSQPNN